jgi:hypothetical protein
MTDKCYGIDDRNLRFEGNWRIAEPSLPEYLSIHIVIIWRAEIIPADSEEFPLTFRAELRSWGRGTTTAAILQKKLLVAFRTTVMVHPLSIILLCIKPVIHSTSHERPILRHSQELSSHGHYHPEMLISL